MKVKVEGFGAYRDVVTHEVKRVTKTMIITTWGKSERRFRRKDGYPVGWDGWSGHCIRREELDRINAAADEGKL